MIRVLLADDHPIVRSGIRNELARHPDIQVVGEAMDGDAAFALATALEPDVLLLDIHMPGKRAVHVVRELQERPQPTNVLILTAYGDLENILGMLKAGATGYLLKDEDPSIIAEGLRAVARGETWLSASIAESLRRQADQVAAAPVFDQLSGRELEVLRYVARGFTNPQISEALCISEGTTKNHVANLYSKLGTSSRAETVAWAWEHGIIERDKRAA